jgi:hypothetical protein
MKPFANKTPQIVGALDSLFPGTKQAAEAGNCTWCKKPVTEFRNEISKREYGISGFCQKCQDEVFGAD